MPRKTAETQTKKTQHEYRSSDALTAAGKGKPKKEVTLHLPQPHPKQHELISAIDNNPGVRFVAGACGTKFGV